MTDSPKPSHWNSLAAELGAETRAEEPRPVSPAHVKPPVVPPRRRIEPVGRVQRPASDWGVLASDLGLEPLPPRPKAPPVPPPIPAPPAKPHVERPAVERREVPERRDVPERQLQVEKPSASAEAVDEVEDRWGADLEDLEADEDTADAATAEPADEAPPKSGRKRRRRRRGGRKQSEGARERGAHVSAEREPDLFAPPTEEDEAAPSASETEAEPVARAEADSGVSGEEAEPAEREGRRRRRRRRGGRKNGKPAAEKELAETPEDDEDLTIDGELESLSEEEGTGVDAGAADLEGGEEEDASGESRDLKSHRSIPSWSEAIGAIIAVNMEARAKNPSQGSGAPRGRGWGRGRGRSSGGRRP
jgi:hypothetical protein